MQALEPSPYDAPIKVGSQPLVLREGGPFLISGLDIGSDPNQFINCTAEPDLSWQTMASVPDHDDIFLYAQSDETQSQNLSVYAEEGWSEPDFHVCAYSIGCGDVRTFYSTQKDGWNEGNLRLRPSHWMLRVKPVSE